MSEQIKIGGITINVKETVRLPVAKTEEEILETKKKIFGGKLL